MRIALFAYSSLGARTLGFLLRSGATVAAVFTHEDDPGESIWFPSVARQAAQAALPVFRVTPHRRWDDPGILRDLRPDLLLSAGFRSPLGARVLALPRLGALNLHPSLLPRHRGRSPVNWAILEGERETGLTLHHMIEEVDAGDIVLARRVPIGPDDAAIDVIARLDAEVDGLLADALPLLESGRAPRRPQNASLATRHGGRRPGDGRIDWQWPASRIHNLVRAVTHPVPGAFTRRRGRKILIWRSRCLPERGADPERGVRLESGGFAIGTGDGLLEVLRFGLEGEEERPGSRLRDFWIGRS